MQNQLPTWVLCGAVVLAFSAGILNTTALMGFTHVSASHVTGNISLLAVTSFHHDWQNLWLLLISVASFWLGSVLSGMIIGGSELHIKRHYGYAMHLEFVLLCGSLWLYLSGNNYGQMLIAMACGLQNSMVATYHGAVLRTTHLTGLTSDLGATVGHWLVGRKVSLAKVALQSALWWGFFGGGFVAVWLYAKYGYWSMLLPITVIFVSAISYSHMEKWFYHSKRMIKFVIIKRKRKNRIKGI
jgi:hypothetical protein